VRREIGIVFNTSKDGFLCHETFLIAVYFKMKKGGAGCAAWGS
jgi:hypothetical protein